MKLTGLKIDGFGIWNGLAIDNLSAGITGFYGRNEAGKTTLMHFIRTVLYGFSPARRQRYLPPVYGGRPGGWLEVQLPIGSVRLERYADSDRQLGHFAAIGEHGKLPTAATLRTALGDIDEATFNNVYAVGLHEMQELGTLSDTDAARWLYSLTTGIDRVSLLDVTRELETARESLLSREGRPSEITQLLDRRAQLQDEIDQLVAQGRRWSQITVQLQELGHEVTQFEAERGLLEYRARTIEIALHVKPMWLGRIELDRQLAPFDGRIRLPDDATSRLDALNKEIEEHDRQSDVLKRQRETLHESVEALGINEMLVRSGSRIEALGEQRDWLEALERQHTALEEELTEIQSKLTSEHDQLGFDLKSVNLDAQSAPQISEGLVATLRPHARAVRTCREKLASAQKESESKQHDEREFRLQLESAMPESVGAELPTDLEEAGDLVANLRRRLHAEQRLEQSRRQEVELQQQNHELLDRQEVPLWMTAVHYLMFGAGTALLLYGILQPSNFAMMVGGTSLVCLLGIHFFRYLDEDQVSQRREACRRQMGLVRKQVESAEVEQREVDRSLGTVNGSVVVRLQTAERHLAELEKLLPVEQRRREARREAEATARKTAEAERKLESALANWQNKLKGLGLPEELTPSDIRSLAGRFEQVTDLRLRAERRRGDVDQRRREYSTLCKRIRNLAEEVHLVLIDSKPIAQLDHLESELRGQWLRVEDRDRIHTKMNELKEGEGRHIRAAEALRHRRESTFVHAGAEDEAAYRQLVREQEQAGKIRNERKAACREITAAIGSHAPEQEIATLLGPEKIGALDRSWEQTTEELETAEEQLKEVVSKRGALSHELDQLAKDRTLTEKQLDLAEVEEQLTRSISKWRAHAAAETVLDQILKRYERERQPETLIEASGYMERLTNGGYRRIWTPLGKEILFVDNSKGESLPVDVLSRGTREQLFLSLRLALVALLARRGVSLPIVLDDVLVNFDEDRARQAVRVLGEFAADGHQLLVFTCHAHVCQMFRELQFDTREIPDRSSVEESTPAPTPALPEPEPEPVAAKLPVEPPFELVESSLEYAFDGDLEHFRPVPIPVVAPEPPAYVEPRRPIVADRPKPKRKSRPEPIYVDAPMISQITVERPPEKPLRVEPIVREPIVREPVFNEPAVELADLSNDEWIRIGPQVRRRERADRRLELEELDNIRPREEAISPPETTVDQFDTYRSLNERVDEYLSDHEDAEPTRDHENLFGKYADGDRDRGDGIEDEEVMDEDGEVLADDDEDLDAQDEYDEAEDRHNEEEDDGEEDEYEEGEYEEDEEDEYQDDEEGEAEEAEEDEYEESEYEEEDDEPAAA